MNKADLINYVVEQSEDVSKALATRMVDKVLEGIKHGLVEDGSVALVDHGTYQVVERAARDGRNPQTGETMKIPASKSVKFKVGKKLKESVKD
jgi:DNA-binding protein HU-beta